MTRSSSRPVVRVRLTGGLANQLFQWAAGATLAREYDATLLLDSKVVSRPGQRGEQVTELLDPSPTVVSPRSTTRTAWRIGSVALPDKLLAVVRRMSDVLERRRPWASDMPAARKALEAGGSVLLRGLFQDVREIEAEQSFLTDHVTAVRPSTTSYAAIHIRRGDYVSNPKYARIFGACSPSYYDTALDLIDRSLPVVVCTDDVAWAREYIAGRPDSSRFRLSDASDHFEDLAILRGADALVLSNSTFSWWAAFLGRSKRTIYPKPWFEDPSRDRELPLEPWIAAPKHAPAHRPPPAGSDADNGA